MSYIGNSPTTTAFVTDTFSGNGSTTAFTMSVAPAATSAVLVAISGVLQDPSTYSVAGTTLTFSAAPPSGTGNISARYLGIPASGVATTAYRTLTEFTATSGQTTFSVPSYVAGFINVFRNGAMLGTADYTATNGTTVVLAVGAVAGDLIAVESFYVSSVLNAIPNTPRSVSTANLPAGTVLQVVNVDTTTATATTSTTFVVTYLTASITPTSATSKIAIFASGGLYINTAGQEAIITIYRNGSNLSGTYGFGEAYAASSNLAISAAVSYVDSPATTSAITYDIRLRATGGTATFPVNATKAGLILMEIAA